MEEVGIQKKGFAQAIIRQEAETTPYLRQRIASERQQLNGDLSNIRQLRTDIVKLDIRGMLKENVMKQRDRKEAVTRRL